MSPPPEHERWCDCSPCLQSSREDTRNSPEKMGEQSKDFQPGVRHSDGNNSETCGKYTKYPDTEPNHPVYDDMQVCSADSWDSPRNVARRRELEELERRLKEEEMGIYRSQDEEDSEPPPTCDIYWTEEIDEIRFGSDKLILGSSLSSPYQNLIVPGCQRLLFGIALLRHLGQLAS